MQVKKTLQYQKKYSLWDSCFIIKNKGDTIRGRVDRTSDQGAPNVDYLSRTIIFFVYPSGKKDQFIPNDIKEMCVFTNSDTVERFLRLEAEYVVSSYGTLYRVIHDTGPCKLIATGTNWGISIYYKESFWGKNEFFKKKNKKAYKDCPSIIDAIENNVFSSDDVIERINAFNNCVSANK